MTNIKYNWLITFADGYQTIVTAKDFYTVYEGALRIDGGTNEIQAVNRLNAVEVTADTWCINNSKE